MPAVAVLGLVGAAIVWVQGQATHGPSNVAELATYPIDLPSVDTIAPADAVINVRTQYGAVGDGKADDTAAIQKAISAGLGFGNLKKILYFPNGTYRVTHTLEWRLANGTWSTWLTLMGQNRDRTVIRLADGAPGFGNPAAPLPVLRTASQNANATDGSGNQAFHNFIFDLTVDVGSGNPGADGLDLLVNNRGALRNVVVRSPTATSGHTGIAMDRRWPGPLLIDNVRVTGFGRGLEIGYSEYSAVINQLRLSGQREYGLANNGNVLSVRGLRSQNVVPAVLNDVLSPTPLSLLTLLDSALSGGQTGTAAVVNNAGAFLRNVQVNGYSMSVLNRGVPNTTLNLQEWSSAPTVAQLGAPPTSKNLPVQDAPAVPVFTSAQWAGVKTSGAVAGDNTDDTTAIQKALDSGKPVVYFGPGRYIISRPLQVPGSVRLILGLDATINATTGVFGPASTSPAFSIPGSAPDPLTVSQVYFETSPSVVDFAPAIGRTLDLRDIHLSGSPVIEPSGQLYLSDVDGGAGWHFTAGQQIWAQQLNIESKGTKITNAGATLWVLGLKTEKPGTAVASTAGAATEVLGALLYPAAAVTDGTPAFSGDAATQSLVFALSGSSTSQLYQIMVTATSSDGTVQSVPFAAAQMRGAAAMLTSYRAGP